MEHSGAFAAFSSESGVKGISDALSQKEAFRTPGISPL